MIPLGTPTNIAVDTTSGMITWDRVTKGSTYKIYVRSYKTVGGKTYYSAYSAYKSIKVDK